MLGHGWKISCPEWIYRSSSIQKVIFHRCNNAESSVSECRRQTCQLLLNQLLSPAGNHLSNATQSNLRVNEQLLLMLHAGWVMMCCLSSHITDTRVTDPGTDTGYITNTPPHLKAPRSNVKMTVILLTWFSLNTFCPLPQCSRSLISLQNWSYL